ncbi:hypothetical protein [Marinicella sp. W31]|uniref:hypothetical protein n=1 Tax=Marinicella sp. W31 TaxID=3023713 RepID=UPI00375826CE
MKSFLCSLMLLLIGNSAYPDSDTQIIEIQFEYSVSADVFEIMDNVSGWWQGFTKPEYKIFWAEKYGVSKKDDALFETYAHLRSKYYNDPSQSQKDILKNRNGFFASLESDTVDPIAQAFYTSNSLEESFGKLKVFLSAEELSFLINFYKNFESKYKNLISESEQEFEVTLDKVRKAFDKKEVKVYFSKVSDFYNVKPHKYRVLYVWWPPLNRTNASTSASNIIMRYNPILHKEIDSSDVIAHEMIHIISNHQNSKQKKALTHKFLKECPDSISLRTLRILEEPLAVAFGQLIFNKKFFPERFEYASNLYNSQWINSMARVMYLPLLERFNNGETINDGFIKEAAILCSGLTASATELLGE